MRRYTIVPIVEGHGEVYAVPIILRRWFDFRRFRNFDTPDLDEEERCRDPFEVFAVCGAAFGDKPDETVQSLARQAMPDRTAEIDRVFEQGEPTLVMLDGLKAGMSYPLVKDCLGTDSALEVAA